MPEMNVLINFTMAWIGFLLGVVSGSIIGLFFHKQEWLGGYDSWRRRLLRLGHIAFFGIGFLNLAFALTVSQLHLKEVATASALLASANILMPAICFLAAWREPFRQLFFIPVGCVLFAIVSLLIVMVQL